MKNKKTLIILGIVVAIVALIFAFMSKSPKETTVNVPVSDIYQGLLDNELSHPDAMVDMSTDALNLYGLTDTEVSDYKLYITQMMPGMDEIFIVKANDGQIDKVMTALNTRVEVLYNEKAFYPGDKEVVDTTKVVSNGDYAMLYLSTNPENADKAVEVFNELTK